MNWPIGSADTFPRRLRHPAASTLLLYEREAQGQYRAPVDMSSLDDPAARELIGESVVRALQRIARRHRAPPARRSMPAEYLAGRQTPVFFGSALTNFGLEPFLQRARRAGAAAAAAR